MFKKIMLVLLSCNLVLLAYSQLQADIQTPKIVSPSPDAAALGKYGQIPIDKSTGVPQISIPLYEIHTPRFSLPISLSYHASGIKVEEISSWVGAGWTLNAGGLITRSIIGLPDDGPFGLLINTVKKASNIQWPADMFYIADVLNRRQDTDPDNFFYNFNNNSGAFVFGEDKNPVLIPYKPIKINFKYTQRTFDVTDDQGNTYYFDAKETVNTDIRNMSCISSWYLTQMISADLTDTIKFIYTADAALQNQYSYNFSQSIENGGVGPYSLQELIKTVTIRQFYTLRISSILFRGGKVEFVAKGGRLDEGIMSLDSVIISNLNPSTNQYDRLKSFKLLTDYFYSTHEIPQNFFVNIPESDKYRLKLAGLQEINGINTVVKTHQFDYNPTMLPQVHSFAQDKWGYFNGKTQNQTLLESQQVTFQPATDSPPQIAIIGGSEGADRNVSEADMQAGILQKITYPTKGYTVFEYESNKQETTLYTPVTLNVTAIGALSQGGSQEITTQLFTPTPDMINSGSNFFTIKLSSGNNSYSSPIPYVKVVRVSDGVKIYNSSDNGSANTQIFNLFLQLDADVQYAITAEAHGTSWPPTSQSPYAIIATTYKIPGGLGIINVGGLRVKSIKQYNSDDTPANTETYYYGKNNESGVGVELAFFPIFHYNHGCYHALTSGYYPPGTIDTYTNNSVYPMATLNGSPVAYPSVTMYHGDPLQNNGKSVYQYDIYPDKAFVEWSSSGVGHSVKPIPVTWKNGDPIWEGHYRNNGNQYYLVKETKNTYDIIERQGGIGTTIGYNHEPIGFNFDNPYIRTDGHVQGGSSSAGDAPIWMQSHFYWFDYPISTGSRVLKQSITTDYAPDGVTGLSTTSSYVYNNLDLPVSITTASSKGAGEGLTKQFKYSGDYPNTEPYNTMVNRNILTPVIEQSVFKGTNTTPLHSTRNNFGFWNGNAWSSTVANIIVPQTVETKNSFALQPNYETRLRYSSYDDRGNVTTVSKENDLQKVYIWGYNKTLPVAEVVGVAYNSIMAILNLNILNNPADDATLRTELNRIRTNFTSAQVVTYTYKPLVGITSQTDANGRTTYYLYDDFGRLQLLKDKDGNILKKYCYNYQGQVENCYISPTVYSSTDYSGTYYSQNCSGLPPESYYVNVPAGMFTSTVSIADANNQALQYAQDQASQNGVCQIPLYFNNYSGFDYIVDITNTVTGQTYYFETSTSNGSGTLGYIPEGTYDIYISGYNDYQYRSYKAGCSDYTNGYGSTNYYAVPLNQGCNTVDIY